MIDAGFSIPPEHKLAGTVEKAVLKAADYLPAHEVPTEEFPLHVITGRTLYHFHTRTKTRRAPELQKAAPDPWVELSPAEAKRAERRARHERSQRIAAKRRAAKRRASRRAARRFGSRHGWARGGGFSAMMSFLAMDCCDGKARFQRCCGAARTG